MLPDMRDGTTWRIGDHGFEATLSPRVLSLIESKLREWCVQWPGEQNLSIDEISHWAIHPGGPKVLDAAQRSLNLPPASHRWSRDMLRDHGNLSSVMLLHILAQMASDDVRGKCVALGFGPGLVLEGFLLER